MTMRKFKTEDSVKYSLIDKNKIRLTDESANDSFHEVEIKGKDIRKRISEHRSKTGGWLSEQKKLETFSMLKESELLKEQRWTTGVINIE